MPNPREPTPTVAVGADFGVYYRSVFTNVRHVEQVPHTWTGVCWPRPRARRCPASGGATASPVAPTLASGGFLPWMFPGQRVHRTRWRPATRAFTTGTREQRYIRALILGQRPTTRSFAIDHAPTTDDPAPLPRATPLGDHDHPARQDRAHGGHHRWVGLRPWRAEGLHAGHGRSGLGRWPADGRTRQRALLGARPVRLAAGQPACRRLSGSMCRPSPRPRSLRRRMLASPSSSPPLAQPVLPPSTRPGPTTPVEHTG